jgi:hypothetical protein
MSDYKKIVENALLKAKLAKLSNGKRTLNEEVTYKEGISERMHSQLEDELANGNHSLSNNKIFPAKDESTFEEKIMGDRFNDVVKRYKRAYDVSSIDNHEVMSNMMPLVYSTISLEAEHKAELERLAVDMIREEYDMSEDVVEIHAELTTKINMVGTKKNPKPVSTELEFKNSDDIEHVKDEIGKRRFLNAMIQGAAKKCNHMFHMVDEELTEIDPRLPNKYAKLMSSADMMFYIIPNMENGINAGVCWVQFPTKDNPKAVIHVQAAVFPVLIHELVKGVMELLSAHGLPKNKKVGEYVINKADYLSAEPWDMRLGPGLWERFTRMIEPDDFKLKHHIYSELASLPVKEFNVKMKEIMAGTKEGKKVISDIVEDVKKGLNDDEFDLAMTDLGARTDQHSDDTETSGGFSFTDVFGGADGDDSDGDSDDSDDGIDFDDLFKKD